MPHAVSGDVPVKRSVLPAGVAGVDETVRQMVKLAHSQWGSKSPRIRALAMNIVNKAGVPSKDYYGEIVAIHNWVRDNIRYFRDPVGQETIADPEQTAFNMRGGDCDDHTILEIALLGAVGIEAWPVVVGAAPDQYSHVYLKAQVPATKARNAGMVIALDPIMKNWSAGREANLKAKKEYRHLANPMTIQGSPMSGLGAYKVGPSYLDTEESHAQLLLVPDKVSSYTHQDRTVASGVRAGVPMEGIDSMFSNNLVEVRPAGDTFTSTSPGDAGTIIEQNGQLVPRGFLRSEPSREEIMAMQPATAAQLGPRGPMFERKAMLDTQRIPKESPTRVQTWSRELRDGRMAPVAVPQVVGEKRYNLTSLQQQLAKKKLVGPGYGKVWLRKTPNITLRAQPVVSLANKPKNLGEAVALAEHDMLMLGAEIQRQKNSIPKLPLAHKQIAVRNIEELRKKLASAEMTVLKLRQKLRDAEQQGQGTPIVARSAAVTAGQRAVNGLAGPVETVTSTLKSPFFYVPVGLASAYLLFRLLRRKSA